jgi:hypothetical protein
MLYETTADQSDGHTHIVELDDHGDGVTEEGGDDLPHVHEVFGNQVQPFGSGDYVSDHPGDPVEVGTASEDEPDDAEMPEDDMNSGCSAQESYEYSDEDSIEEGDEEDYSTSGLTENGELAVAVGKVMLNEDPRAIARQLLFC